MNLDVKLSNSRKEAEMDRTKLCDEVAKYKRRVEELENALQSEKSKCEKAENIAMSAREELLKGRKDNKKALHNLSKELENLKAARAEERQAVKEQHFHAIEELAAEIKSLQRDRAQSARQLKDSRAASDSLKHERDDYRDQMSAFSKKLRVEEKAHKATKVLLSKAKQVAESKDRETAQGLCRCANQMSVNMLNL